jgi:hypothetical protein
MMKTSWRINNKSQRQEPEVERCGQAARRAGGHAVLGEVCDFCRGDGVDPVLFYKWKKQLLGPANRVFENRGAKPSAQEQRLEAEPQRLNTDNSEQCQNTEQCQFIFH